MPLGFATIDAGGSYTNIKNQTHIEKQIGEDDFYFIGYSDSSYQEQTKAAYLSLHHDWDYFGFKAGLRYEHVSWDEDTRDYWLPSLSLSVKPHEGHHLSLSWGTSTIRPNFYDLNPFRVYKSIWEYSEGNPLLKPARISNIELNYYNHKGLYASAYHHHGSNMVIRTTSYSANNRHEYLAETMPQNNGRINQTGLYLRYQLQMSESLLATVDGSGYYHEATAQYDTEDCHLYGWGSRISVSADWYLNTQHTLLLNARYQHWFSDYRDMTETDSYGYFYFALRYAMLGDRLKLSLVANDPFRQFVTDENIYSSRRNISETPSLSYSEDMRLLSHTNHHTHYIGLSATYSFGGKKVRSVHHDLKDSESKRAEKQNF